MSSLEDQIMSGGAANPNPTEEEKDDEKIEDIRDYSKSKFELAVTLNQESIPQNSNVLICNPGASTALVKILFEKSWSEIGKIETTY